MYAFFLGFSRQTGVGGEREKGASLLVMKVKEGGRIVLVARIVSLRNYVANSKQIGAKAGGCSKKGWEITDSGRTNAPVQ